MATDVHPGHLENTGSDTWITRQASHTWTQTNRARALDGAQATPKYLNANRRRSDRHPLPKVMVHLEIESGEPGTPGEHAGKKSSCASSRGGRRTGEPRPRERTQNRPRRPAASRNRNAAASSARLEKPRGHLAKTPAAHAHTNRRTARRGRRRPPRCRSAQVRLWTATASAGQPAPSGSRPSASRSCAAEPEVS